MFKRRSCHSGYLVDMNRNVRKTQYFFVGLMFFCILLGCDALYRILNKEGAQERILIGEVIPSKKNEVVAQIQALWGAAPFINRTSIPPAQVREIAHLCELETVPGWVDPQSLRKLVTIYLMTTDGFLYYIILGIRNIDSELDANSFIYFSEITPELKVFKFYQKFPNSFERKNNAFIQGKNVFLTSIFCCTSKRLFL